MYGHYARITQTALTQVVLGPDFEIVPGALTADEDLLLLVSPNNPTGGGPDPVQIREALLARPRLVFVDEAYADYARVSVIPMLQDLPNLLVGRSLSKSLLAGVRLGYGVGHPAVISTLERLLFAPYHLSALQLLVALHFDQIQPRLAARVEAVVTQRSRVLAGIRRLGLRAWESAGNFILFAVEDARGVNERLLDQGIRLRDVSSMPGLERHLRVTVGDAAENDLFLAALARAI
jgi:histidinol-phosphate aminotransferase